VNKNNEWQACQSITQWHDCVLFGKAMKRIQWGTQVFVEGELQHCKYERTLGKEKLNGR
jgi:single-stranded DNA-binding protein